MFVRGFVRAEASAGVIRPSNQTPLPLIVRKSNSLVVSIAVAEFAAMLLFSCRLLPLFYACANTKVLPSYRLESQGHQNRPA
jgi:hypothetical protein